MKNILVATDFSNNAYAALFYATQLLASKPCNFYILNAFTENTLFGEKDTRAFAGKNLSVALKAKSEEKLKQTFHKINLDNDNGQHEFQTLSVKGNLTPVMQRAIEKYDIDLVVMGTKGNTGAKEIFIGSNTMKVTHAINQCPILAVPKEIDYKTPKEIAFFTDFKKGCAKKTIAPLLFIASLFSSAIRVAHIEEEHSLEKEQESHRKLLELSLTGFEHSFHSVQDAIDKAKVINDFLEENQVELFSMVQRKRSLFELWYVNLSSKTLVFIVRFHFSFFLSRNDNCHRNKRSVNLHL